MLDVLKVNKSNLDMSITTLIGNYKKGIRMNWEFSNTMTITEMESFTELLQTKISELK